MEAPANTSRPPKSDARLLILPLLTTLHACRCQHHAIAPMRTAHQSDYLVHDACIRDKAEHHRLSYLATTLHPLNGCSTSAGTSAPHSGCTCSRNNSAFQAHGE